MMTLGLCYNLFLSFYGFAFRESKQLDFTSNILKTLIQIIFIWVITLFIIPLLIHYSFGEAFTFDAKSLFLWAGIVVFLLGTILGLRSA